MGAAFALLVVVSHWNVSLAGRVAKASGFGSHLTNRRGSAVGDAPGPDGPSRVAAGVASSPRSWMPLTQTIDGGQPNAQPD
jgi:hypothetical protein